MLTLVGALDSSLRKAYGYEWEQNIDMAEAGGDRRRLRCSFRGRGEGAATRVIAGGSAGICNECIGVCVEILKDAEDARPGGGTA
jgi:hypothetical protein